MVGPEKKFEEEKGDGFVKREEEVPGRKSGTQVLE